MLTKTELIEKLEHLALVATDERAKVKALDILLQHQIMVERELELRLKKKNVKKP